MVRIFEPCPTKDMSRSRHSKKKYHKEGKGVYESAVLELSAPSELENNLGRGREVVFRRLPIVRSLLTSWVPRFAMEAIANTFASPELETVLVTFEQFPFDRDVAFQVIELRELLDLLLGTVALTVHHVGGGFGYCRRCKSPEQVRD